MLLLFKFFIFLNNFKFGINHLLFIDFTSFVADSLVFVNVNRNNIKFVEFASPPLRNFVLNFLQDLLLVWTLCKSLIDRVLMEFIKFIIKSSYHFLYF